MGAARRSQTSGCLVPRLHDISLGVIRVAAAVGEHVCSWVDCGRLGEAAIPVFNGYMPLATSQLRIVSTAHILSLVGSRPINPKSVSNPALAAIVRRVCGVK